MKSFSFLVLLFVISLPAISQPKGKEKFVIPRYFLANAEVTIYGPFDADGTNTHICFVNDSNRLIEVKPLIETSKKILIKVPDSYGRSNLFIYEETKKIRLTTRVNLIKLKTEYEELSSNRRRNTKFRAQFLGANKIEDEISFTFKNRSPHVINIIGGNVQKHKIMSAIKDELVCWEGEMKTLDKGDFIIWFNVEQPPPTEEITVQ